jgi:tetratricopeptide (TPR) repeat protein
MSKARAIASCLGLWLLTTVWNAGVFDRMTAIRERLTPQLIALPRPEVAKLTSLGFDAVLADFYFIGATHYLGEYKYIHVAYGELYNYIRLVIYLAPDFKSAYRFGGMAIPWNTGEKWVNVEQAVDVLERGVQRFPDDWFLSMMLAYDYSAYLHQYKKAGDILTRAARLPQAPAYLADLATRMYATTGDLQSAYEFAQRIMQETPEANVKAAMAQRMREIEVQRGLEILDDALNRFRAQQGRLPASLRELVSGGVLQQLPADPLGGEYQYDPGTGVVTSSNLKSRLKVYEGKAK